jgi:hypothetical protein
MSLAGCLRELAPGADATLRAHLEASRDADVGLARLALTGLAGLGSPTPETWCVDPRGGRT